MWSLWDRQKLTAITKQKEPVILKEYCKARTRGLVVKADDSQSRGCGFKPPYTGWNASKASYCIKNKEIQVAERGRPKKYFFKEYCKA